MAANKIVLAYSGGLDTSVILKWLQENYQCPVVAFAADLGQKEDWNAVREKGLATGAEKVVIADLKETFVKDFIFPSFRFGSSRSAELCCQVPDLSGILPA